MQILVFKALNTSRKNISPPILQLPDLSQEMVGLLFVDLLF